MEGTITESIIVKGTAEDAYDAWSDVTTFPKFMSYVDQVEVQEDGRIRWTVDGPAGTHVTWEAQFTRQERPDRLAWSSKDDSGPVTTSGQVTFHQLPDDQTEVTVILKFSIANDAVDFVAERFANAEEKVAADLRAFKARQEGRSLHESA